jgi:hypothetical protein
MPIDHHAKLIHSDETTGFKPALMKEASVFTAIGMPHDDPQKTRQVNKIKLLVVALAGIGLGAALVSLTGYAKIYF